MPSTSLNQDQMAWQLALKSARQLWIGLPEGALFKPRLNILTCPSKPTRIFASHFVSSSRTSASPCAGTLRDLARRRRPRIIFRVRGQLEDGVPHARALSPANRRTSTS